MPHSHSTPAGVDGGSRTPPTTPRKAGKMLAVRVQMLDDTITMFQVQVIFITVSWNGSVHWQGSYKYKTQNIKSGMLSFQVYTESNIS